MSTLPSSSGCIKEHIRVPRPIVYGVLFCDSGDKSRAIFGLEKAVIKLILLSGGIRLGIL